MTIGDGHDLKSSRFAGDEVLEACYDKERVLRRGDSGSAVKKVQEALIILRIPVPEAGASGIFGDETELAVRSYQEARGLKVDGVIGPETMGSLDEEFHTGPATEHRVSPSTEPYVSDVSSPLTPESPVRSPRASPVETVKAPEVPPVKAPRAPRVGAPPVQTPKPPEVPAAPVAEPPILATQTVPPEQTPARVTRPTIPPVTLTSHTVDNQGRKFHSAGTWKGSSSFEVEAGESIHFEIANNSNMESNLRIKTNTGEVATFVLHPLDAVDMEFSMANKEPFIWRFYIETDGEKSLIDWKLYSTWVPGAQENP